MCYTYMFQECSLLLYKQYRFEIYLSVIWKLSFVVLPPFTKDFRGKIILIFAPKLFWLTWSASRKKSELCPWMLDRSEDSMNSYPKVYISSSKRRTKRLPRLSTSMLDPLPKNGNLKPPGSLRFSVRDPVFPISLNKSLFDAFIAKLCPVWPNLAKVHLFSKMLKVLGNFSRVS